MNLLILGKKGIAIQGDLEKDLDNSWNIFNWEPSESPDKLVNFLETADVAITGSDALIYGNILNIYPHQRILSYFKYLLLE